MQLHTIKVLLSASFHPSSFSTPFMVRKPAQHADLCDVALQPHSCQMQSDRASQSPHLDVICVVGHASMALCLVMMSSIIGKHLQQQQQLASTSAPNPQRAHHQMPMLQY